MMTICPCIICDKTVQAGGALFVGSIKFFICCLSSTEKYIPMPQPLLLQDRFGLLYCREPPNILTTFVSVFFHGFGY